VIVVNAQEFQDYGVKVETVAENLDVPWAIAFAPDGRIFFTERDKGTLRVIEGGQLRQEPVIKYKVFKEGAGGLLGLALDPSFEENHYMYLYYTSSENFTGYMGMNKVGRYTEKDNKLSNETVLIDKIPGGPVHDGGRLKFGPDGKLYITTGDAGHPQNTSQNQNSLGGKVLRINSDGTIPDDNPFPNSPVYSYGHRNPQGLSWDPVTGKLVISEHGPNCPKRCGMDEVNVIEPGKNYGWPIVFGEKQKPKFVDPLLQTGNETWAPSGATFYNSDVIPEWDGKYFIAALRGTHLRMLDLDLEKNEVISSEALFSNEFGRLRDVSVGPDGSMYLLTSNRDGRVSLLTPGLVNLFPAENDDKILRIVPIEHTDEKKIDDSYLPPLKQSNAGIPPSDVECRSEFKLLLKSISGTPVCVKPSSASKLVERGWGIYG